MTDLKICDLCRQETRVEGDDVLYFGEWMTLQNITVHYYCLLLSTHLPQRGQDHSGILGFLGRDIRKEMTLAKSRKCMYCEESNATIMCHTCKEYFHLTCGFTSMTLSQFKDQFHSYCHKCIPFTDRMKQIQKESPHVRCGICFEQMGSCQPTRWIYGECCGNGYIHSKCMKIYALKAGYYLRCIWCKNTKFRDNVKDLGIFVPDREATWEQNNGRLFQDFYRGHQRCDMEYCNCPKGRDYDNGRKWSIIICNLCGSYGAHNPLCIPGMEHEKEKLLIFKCETCSVTEQTVCSQTMLQEVENENSSQINTSLFVQKDIESLNMCGGIVNNPTEFSDDSMSSTETVINNNLLKYKTMSEMKISSENMLPTTSLAITHSNIPTLTQSPERPDGVVASVDPVQQAVGEKETNTHFENSKQTLGSNLEKPDPRIIRMLVQRMLDLFET